VSLNGEDGYSSVKTNHGTEPPLPVIVCENDVTIDKSEKIAVKNKLLKYIRVPIKLRFRNLYWNSLLIKHIVSINITLIK
jgi:hypothetical protein